MAETTGISWADSTANLWIGCTKVSAACDNCYAADLMGSGEGSRMHRVEWGPHGDRSYCKAGWSLIRKMQKRAAANGGVDPDLGRKRRIFVNSLSDMFDNHKSIIWRDDAFVLFEQSPDVIIMLVTKRPQLVAKMVPDHWLHPGGWPAHVWLITTVENQEEAERRIPALLEVPGVAVRGLSVEPMLGPVDLKRISIYDRKNGIEINALIGVETDDLGPRRRFAPIGWVICGGESGKHARQMDPHWVAALQLDCQMHGIPFHFKQWGEWIGHIGGPEEADSIHLAPGQVEYRRVGKAAAGRKLFGREHLEFPDV